jgi:hypothetical protein
VFAVVFSELPALISGSPEKRVFWETLRTALADP